MTNLACVVRHMDDRDLELSKDSPEETEELVFQRAFNFSGEGQRHD
jgi:hypothetical protein